MDSLDAASPTNSADKPDDSGGALVDVLLLDTSEEGEPDYDSHREPSLEPDSAESSSPEPEPERQGPEGGAT